MRRHRPGLRRAALAGLSAAPGTPLLFWSSLCFVGLTLDNLFLFADRILLPAVDLSVYRQPTALVAVGVLLYGMIWKTRT